MEPLGWEWVAATVVAAFIAAFLGAAAGWWLQRGAQLRAARVRVYEEHLSPFHDLVAQKCAGVAKSGEPTSPDPVSALLSPFAVAATVASGKDRKKVTPIWGKLDRISKKYRAFQGEANKYDRGDPRFEETYRKHAGIAQPMWDELNEYLWEYKGWLEWKFTKGLFSFKPGPPIRSPDES